MTTPQRLPIVNGDDGAWGDIIRQFLTKEHYNAVPDADNPANGGHQNVTIRPGTATAAPLTFMGGTNLTTPVAGSVEYDGTYFYLTEASNVRKRVMNYFATNTQSGTTYAVAASDTVIFANAASNAITVTLPAASSFTGYRFYIKRIDGSVNGCTVATNGTDLMDGVTSITLNTQYQAIGVVSNGAAWYIL
jgi:hypothetical protein